MALKRIIVDGGGVKLRSNDDLRLWLERQGVRSLVDNEGDEVGGFDTLQPGGEYKLGPSQQQQQQDGKLRCCFRIVVFNVLFATEMILLIFLLNLSLH